MQVKGEVVPENRAEIESSIRKSLDTVVASDSVEVSQIVHKSLDKSMPLIMPSFTFAVIVFTSPPSAGGAEERSDQA